MANYDQRLLLDNRFGQISGAVVASATVLTSDDFAALPSDLSLTRFIPIVLADDSAKVYEVVWATGHVEGSKNLTVIRGREGSTAKVWNAGTAWRHGPLARDGQVTVATRSGLPTDAHLGMRCMIRDENRVVEKTTAGWRATETIFGHAGRTAGNQAGDSGTVTMTAAQDLQGGMAFTSGALVVPIAGRYLVTCRVQSTLSPTGRITGQIAVNGAVPVTSPAPQTWKGDANNIAAQASTTMPLDAGAALTLRYSVPSGGAVPGTTGYDGAWIEALYVGP